jgi:hypothetical protein
MLCMWAARSHRPAWAGNPRADDRAARHSSGADDSGFTAHLSATCAPAARTRGGTGAEGDRRTPITHII